MDVAIWRSPTCAGWTWLVRSFCAADLYELLCWLCSSFSAFHLRLSPLMLLVSVALFSAWAFEKVWLIFPYTAGQIWHHQSCSQVQGCWHVWIAFAHKFSPFQICNQMSPLERQNYLHWRWVSESSSGLNLFSDNKRPTKFCHAAGCGKCRPFCCQDLLSQLIRVAVLSHLSELMFIVFPCLSFPLVFLFPFCLSLFLCLVIVVVVCC